MRSYIDIRESLDGDLITVGGDFDDTSMNPALCVDQLVRTIVSIVPSEFIYFPTLGFNASAYEGSPNTRRVGNQIAESLKTALSEQTYLYYPEIEVTPFPVSDTEMAMRFRVLTLPNFPMESIIMYDTQTYKFNAIKPLPGIFGVGDMSVAIPPTINSRS